MKQEVTRVLADGAAASAVSLGAATKLGWFEFINTNAPALGFLASCIFGIIATVFYLMTYSKATQSDQNKKDLQAHIKETEVSFNHVNSGIDEILSKLTEKNDK